MHILGLRYLILCLILGSNYLKAQYDIDTTLLGQNPKIGKYAKIRGINVYFEQYGQGEPLIMIHGNGGSMKEFKKQLPYFASQYRVILADSRAHGNSLDPEDSLSYEMMSDDLYALSSHLQLDSSFVLGWSDGGIIGIMLAMRHPEKVKKLAISGANLWPDSTALDPWFCDMLPKWINEQVHDSSISARNQGKLLKLMQTQPNIRAENLKNVKCHTLVINGDHDIILPKHALLIYNSLPKASLWIASNAGHAIHMRYPELFNNQVSTFFQAPFRSITKEQKFD